MSAGHNSGAKAELSILIYLGHHVPCPLNDVVEFASRQMNGIPVSQKWVVSILEQNDYRIVNEGSTLIVEVGEPLPSAD